MSTLILILYCAAFSFLNMGAGRKFWGATNSTGVGRCIGLFLMAYLTELVAFYFNVFHIAITPLIFGALMLWRSPGWGKYFAAITGQLDPAEKEFPPVDWIMRRLPLKTHTEQQVRIWGTVAMALRHSLISASVLVLAWLTGNEAGWALMFPLMGVAYYVAGVITREIGKEPFAVQVAEGISAIIIAVMYFNVCS